MSIDELIYLPVSLGEAIDKLTILDIKLDKIKDNRKVDVQKEYDLLYEKINTFIIKYNDLYQTMKKVNILIWDLMDILRDDYDNSKYLETCRKCIEYNDVRFRIKNKINCISKSQLKEQKSYKINCLLIEINNDIKDITEFIKPIKYYSFIYDKIIINNNNVLLKEYFLYDNTIEFVLNGHNNNEYIKKYAFINNEYKKEQIYEIFELTNINITILLN